MRRASLHIILSISLTLALSVQLPGGQKGKSTPSRPPQTVPTKPANTEVQSELSRQEQEIIAEINLARSNPGQYVRYVEEFKRRYLGNAIKFPDGTSLVTNEGIAAADEAIDFLRLARPEKPLEVRNGLVLAAKAHLDDLLRTGRTGHKGSDGSYAKGRLSRYGTWSDSVGEDIVYQSRSARDNIIALIIDDGVPNRGHRRNIFKSTFHVIGIALAPPATSSTICVITFAGGFVDKSLSNTKAAATKF